LPSMFVEHVLIILDVRLNVKPFGNQLHTSSLRIRY
jgi:hypothetical protein